MDDELMLAGLDLATAAERLAHAPPLESTVLAQDVIDCLAVWRAALDAAENRRRRAMLAESRAGRGKVSRVLRAAMRGVSAMVAPRARREGSPAPEQSRRSGR